MFALGFLYIFTQFSHVNMWITHGWYVRPDLAFHILYLCRILSNPVERFRLQIVITIWIIKV